LQVKSVHSRLLCSWCFSRVYSFLGLSYSWSVFLLYLSWNPLPISWLDLQEVSLRRRRARSASSIQTRPNLKLILLASQRILSLLIKRHQHFPSWSNYCVSSLTQQLAHKQHIRCQKSESTSTSLSSMMSPSVAKMSYVLFLSVVLVVILLPDGKETRWFLHWSNQKQTRKTSYKIFMKLCHEDVLQRQCYCFCFLRESIIFTRFRYVIRRCFMCSTSCLGKEYSTLFGHRIRMKVNRKKDTEWHDKQWVFTAL
jgi:hypothetical protein